MGQSHADDEAMVQFVRFNTWYKFVIVELGTLECISLRRTRADDIFSSFHCDSEAKGASIITGLDDSLRSAILYI